MKLSREQIEHYKKLQVPNGVPCRFMSDGRCLNISTGELQPQGINVMHQRVYWNFSRETAKKIASTLGCRVVFSESFK
ncbi:MAG TPA: hypothetical protein PKK48_00915 [Phycisphaerae bacterium]|nr:hypothetical protein [Phycisphaerae bacterium]